MLFGAQASREAISECPKLEVVHFVLHDQLAWDCYRRTAADLLGQPSLRTYPGGVCSCVAMTTNSLHWKSMCNVCPYAIVLPSHAAWHFLCCMAKAPVETGLH